MVLTQLHMVHIKIFSYMFKIIYFELFFWI
jgi:hypothetical protein